MDLRHLRYLVAVAEEMTFTRAAVRLRVAQPPLSHQIKQLETELGVQLLRRGRRRTELTPAGEIFYARAKNLLRDAARLVEHTQRAARGELGTLKIGYVAALSCDFIPRVLRRLKQLHPGIEIFLNDLPETEQFQALREKRIDLGFMSLAPQNSEPDLASAAFHRERLGMLLPVTHRLARAKRYALRDLRGDRMIAIDPQVSPHAYAMLMSLYAKFGLATGNVLLGQNGQAIIDFVSAGFGVAVVPALFRQRMGTSAVFRELNLPPIQFHYCWNRRNVTPVVDTFLQIIAEEIRARR
jgi:DNA-binding transcriptional LysR family regulator